MLTVWYRFFNCEHLGVPHDLIADGKATEPLFSHYLKFCVCHPFTHRGCMKNTPSHGLLTKFIPLIMNSVLYSDN